MKSQFLKLSLLFSLFCFSSLSFAQTIDETYLDPTQPVETRVDSLLAQMTLDEKIGQMTLVELNSLDSDHIVDYAIGGILSGGGGSPRINVPEEWAKMVDGFQTRALETRLKIPMIYGVDAVHGHNNVYSAVIFPHNIGLGATRNPELVRRLGQATACDMIATGIYWNYAPVVAVPQDIRWGRIYEGYGQDTELVTEMSLAFMQGLQGDSLDDPYTVLATVKHFVGDGGTGWGTSTTGDYQIDQGDMQVDEQTLRTIHLPPYEAAIQNGALSIMVSFSSWNSTKMHAEKYLMTNVLKGELGFNGFLVSDWGGIDQIDANYYNSVVTSINAGVDMNMVPYDYLRFIDVMHEAVEKGDISMERIDDAVRRILRVKFILGLFEEPFSDPGLLANFSNDSFRELGRQAVAQSAVLLKNEGDVLPLSTDITTVFVAGEAAHDLGIQTGGWTITWQGGSGSFTEGTTIRDAIEAAVGENTSVHFDRFGRFERVTDEGGNPLKADVGIVVLGEKPYAEGVGDRADLNLPEADLTLVERMREKSDKLIVILISGRPLLVEEVVNQADAFIAAWLPGTEGQGIADVLFGLQPFTGKLSLAFPRNMSQVPLSALRASSEPPLFAYGDGITTGGIDDVTLVDVKCGQ